MSREDRAAPLDGPTLIPAPSRCGSGAVEEAAAIWRALAALGVRDVVIAPGSRSAPFVHALAQADLRAHVRIDERAAAFTALGLSRADPAHPAAVLTTSGTATAHLHAAVLEAHHARVPLIVLTADRPAELRGVGANQATHQADLYGGAVRLAADLPAPRAEGATEPELRTAVSTLARALAAATGARPGPVHLNIGLRDPLTPQRAPEPSDLDPLVLTRRLPPGPPAPVEVPLSGRTVLVAGDGAGAEAERLARTHDLPLLAEPSSGARGGAALRRYPSLLRAAMADAHHALRPDRALVLGHPTLSRPVLSALLGAPDVEVVIIDPTEDWNDAARRARLVVPAARPIADEQAARAQRRFLAAWRAAEEASSIPSALPWQVRAALAVWDAGGPQDTLVLGSSSLVRDLEEHAGPSAARVIANRGLAGIDGLISTATGCALARRGAPGRVRALIGDLTALHDLTGLLIGPEEEQPELDVVVVDDGGGRIFAGLEHAAAPPAVLRRFFTTPHGADIAAAGRALGCPALRCEPEDLPRLLAADPGGRRLIVVTATGGPSS